MSIASALMKAAERAAWTDPALSAELGRIAMRAEAAEAEVERLRQGLWDCFREAGGDTDGDETPGARKSYLVPLAVECVRDLRECYAQSQDECSAAEADARRYRWLRDKARKETAHDRYGTGAHWSIGLFAEDGRQTFGAAIDAELAKEPKP